MTVLLKMEVKILLHCEIINFNFKSHNIILKLKMTKMMIVNKKLVQLLIYQ